MLQSGQLNRRYDYNSDDDAGSEVSSLHSESMSQFGASSRCTEDVGDVIRYIMVYKTRVRYQACIFDWLEGV